MPRELITREEVTDCFFSLWESAFKANPFEAVCALLRISGMQDANWDTFIESEDALNDYSLYLDIKDDKLSNKSTWRIGLLIYCHIFEMSAVHDTIANILRILKGDRCHLNPLGYLAKPIKKHPFKNRPPSANTKWKTIKELAEPLGRENLISLIESISHDSIRNAFSHSDYIITDEYFRWTEGGLPSQVYLEEVDTLILNSFRFFSGFIGMRNLWLHISATLPRYHKWKNYEVLELLKNDDQEPKLIGFKLHFSNGSTSMYKRTKDGVDCLNIIIQRDGTIEFMCGSLDNLTKRWMVDGKIVDFKNTTTANSFED